MLQVIAYLFFKLVIAENEAGKEDMAGSSDGSSDEGMHRVHGCMCAYTHTCFSCNSYQQTIAVLN